MLDLRLAGAGPPIGDVLGQGAVEQDRFLLHDAICDLSDACLASAMSCPSIRMRPWFTSYSRWISLTKVVLPDPEWPTRPTRSPGQIDTEKSR